MCVGGGAVSCYLCISWPFYSFIARLHVLDLNLNNIIFLQVRTDCYVYTCALCEIFDVKHWTINQRCNNGFGFSVYQKFNS